MHNPRKLVSSPSFLRRARSACAGVLGVAAILIGGPVSAQVSPLMGQWFAQTPTTQWRFIFTAGDAVTYQVQTPTGVIIFVARYELVGLQLHVIPVQASLRTALVPWNCVMQFDGPNTFLCRDLVLTRG
jgi:hypothetical protein